MLVACSSTGDSGEKAIKVVPTGDAAPLAGNAATTSPQDIRYDNTISGLERLMRDLRVAISGKDEQRIGVLVASLRLPDHESWMKKVFGSELGLLLSQEYRPQLEEIGLLAEVLAEQYEMGLVEVEGYRFQTADVPTSTGYQSAALKQMNSTVPLYSARLYSEGRERTFHLWSFVHEGGSFRYIGKLKSVTSKRARGGRDLNEYRLLDAERLAAQDPR